MLEQEAERRELDFERQPGSAPQTLFGPEANIAVLVIIQILEKIGQGVGHRLERLGRQHLGAAVDIGEIEALGRWGRGLGGLGEVGRAKARHWAHPDTQQQHKTQQHSKFHGVTAPSLG